MNGWLSRRWAIYGHGWRWGLWTLFLIYTGWMLWLLLFRRLGTAPAASLSEYAAGHLVLAPLRTIREQLGLLGRGSRQALANLGGNLLLFLPYGWFLPVLFRPLRRFGRFLAVFAGSVILVELLQLVLRVGVCDVDDLLLNSLGASVGFLIWNMARKEKA